MPLLKALGPSGALHRSGTVQFGPFGPSDDGAGGGYVETGSPSSRLADPDAAPAAPSTAPDELTAGSRRAGMIVTVVVVIVTLALGAVLVAAQLPGDGLPRDAIGAEAPSFSLPTLGGDTIALADAQGGPAVLAFWASWCTTCKADVPKLQQVVDEWGPRGVSVVGVVIEDSLAAAQATATEAGMRYPSVFDADNTVRDAYGVLGTPETFLVDGDGRVAARWIGPLPAHELDLRLAALTAETG